MSDNVEPKIGKVLAAVDGSEPSLKALRTAAAIARGSGAKLTIVEVIEPFGPLPGYYGAPPEGVERKEWLAEQRFEKAHAWLLEAGVEWERRVLEGSPPDEICSLAEKEHHDLIVLGDRGQSAIGRFLTGSVADRVVHHAPCSVLVAR